MQSTIHFFILYHFKTRSGESDPNSLNMDPASESSGMVTAGSRVRRRRRCIWVTSVIAGLAAVVIIAATIQNRRALYDGS